MTITTVLGKKWKRDGGILPFFDENDTFIVKDAVRHLPVLGWGALLVASKANKTVYEVLGKWLVVQNVFKHTRKMEVRFYRTSGGDISLKGMGKHGRRFTVLNHLHLIEALDSLSLGVNDLVDQWRYACQDSQIGAVHGLSDYAANLREAFHNVINTANQELSL